MEIECTPLTSILVNVRKNNVFILRYKTHHYKCVSVLQLYLKQSEEHLYICLFHSPSSYDSPSFFDSSLSHSSWCVSLFTMVRIPQADAHSLWQVCVASTSDAFNSFRS